ncbi:MAG TPA: DUF5069 domain-containing protein [Candidatus Baltobacteraceae bacterium]|nr:DUF5069 domain-containing protein [Candidatus Baltobacteraceae bacterium]
MEPLDLRLAPPRGPREKLAGLMFLPRVIDKLRATLPGGSVGAYFPYQGLSALFERLTHIDLYELRDRIAGAEREADVEAWVAARVNGEIVSKTNHVMERVTIEKISPDNLPLFESAAPAHLRERYRNLFDLLEVDDRESFQGIAEG